MVLSPAGFKPKTSLQSSVIKIRQKASQVSRLARKLLPKTVIWHRGFTAHYYSPDILTTLNLSAFTITLTEDSDIAAAAKIGDKSMPKNG